MDGELFSHTTRNVEKDCEGMTAMLIEKGWAPVGGPIRKVAFSNLPLMNKAYEMEEGSFSLFRATENTDRQIRTSLGALQPTYMAMPYVLLTHKTMRLGLSQVAGGTAIGAMRYE